MKVVEGLGFDQAYLERGAKRAKQDQGQAFNEKQHPITREDVRGFVDREYEVAAARYQNYYMTCMHAALWRYGQHSIQINPHSFMFETIPVDLRIPRPSLNLIGDKVESVVGDIIKSTPRGSVVPMDNTPMNRRGAQIGEAYLRVKDEEDHIDELLYSVAETGTIWGDAYVEVVVDKASSRSVEVPMFVEGEVDGQGVSFPVTDENGQPVMQTMSLADESANLITPLQIFFNQTATSLKTSRKAHSHTYQDIEWARSQWPRHADKMSTASLATQAGQFQTRLQNLLLHDASRVGGLVAPMTAGDPTFCEEAALIHVVRMNPDEYYPQGRYFIVAGNVAVVGGPLPFGKLMMVHWRYSPVPNSMLSYGLVKDCIEVNRWIEQMAHQTGMIRRTMGVPFILAPEGTGGSFAGAVLPMRYGGIYTYKKRGDASYKPEVVHPRGGMDSGTSAEMDFWLNDFFERISGKRRASEGDKPQGTYSGILLRQMIAQNAGRFMPKITGFHKMNEQLYSLRLEAIAKAPASQYPRGVSFLGRAGQRLWTSFSADDMGDNVVYKIETVSAVQLDETTKLQDTLDLASAGFIDPMDPKTRISVLRMFGRQDLISDLEPNIEKAWEENALISAGEQVVIGPYENDLVHLQVHVDWINAKEFWLVPEAMRMATIAHAVEHEERIKLRLMEAEASGQMPSPNPSVNGTPVLPPPGAAPGMQPGNGIPGKPQASVAAQQQPKPVAA